MTMEAERERDVVTEVEVRVMWPQARGYGELLEAEKGEKRILP